MALLEYATFTVPDVVKKSVVSFYNQDPLLQALQSRHKVKRSGGTEVRIRRVKSAHSQVTEINATNMSVPLSKTETLSLSSFLTTTVIVCRVKKIVQTGYVILLKPL